MKLKRRELMIATVSGLVLWGCDDSSDTSFNNELNNTNDSTGTNDGTNINNTNNTNNTNDGTNNINNTNNENNNTNNQNNNIAEHPPTTIDETIRGVLLETEQFEDLRPQYGKTQVQEGEPYIERDDLNVAQLSDGTTPSLNSLAYFVHLTDIHIVDEESPARFIHSVLAEASAWRPQEPWSTQVLNAAVKTINEFHTFHAFDFVLFTGDLIDNKHWIELRWFLDVLEGNDVNPNTGDLNDTPTNIPDNLNPHLSFKPEGFLPDIKWYIIMGNHDMLAGGNLGALKSLLDPTGSTATDLPTQGFDSDYVSPTCLDEPPCWDRDDNGSSFCYSDQPQRCYVPPDDSWYDDPNVPPDERRHYVSRAEWMQMIMDSTKNGPQGHGFTNENIQQNVSYWASSQPVENSPVVLIGLDTNCDEDSITASATGKITQEQLDWLESKLDEFSNQGKVIIVASHHPSDGITGGEGGSALQQLLHSYPNVVLHLVGHGHKNLIYPRPAPTGYDIWHGYWEIQTCGLLDWPQQIRFLEIVDIGDGTGAIYSTMINLDIKSGDITEAARFYSLVHIQEGLGDNKSMGTNGDSSTCGENKEGCLDRNVILKFAWSPVLKDSLKNLNKRAPISVMFMRSRSRV